MNIKFQISKICGLISKFLSSHKVAVSIGVVLTALCIISVSGAVYALKKRPEPQISESTLSAFETFQSLAEIPSDQASSKEEQEESVQPESSEQVTSSKTSSATKKETPAKKQPQIKPAADTGYKYNTNSDIDDNIFLDALIYTGYNIEKHRADGMMWQYILASQKRGAGLPFKHHLRRRIYGL